MPLTLMSVPREVRNNILEQLLLEHKEMYPYGYAVCECSCCTPTPPDLSIMRVNKPLNAEATELLYSNATFNMRSGIQFAKFFDNRATACLHGPPEASQVYASRHLIKRITLDIVPEISLPNAHLSHLKYLWEDPGFRRLSARERKREVHESECAFSMLTWGHNMHMIQVLQGLKHVLVDIKGLICTHGCCRMVRRLGYSLKNSSFKSGLRFAVVGQALRGENEFFATRIERCGERITAFYDARDDFDVEDDHSESGHEDSDDDQDNDDGQDTDDDQDTDEDHESDDYDGGFGTGMDSDGQMTDEEDDESDEDGSTSEEQEYYPAE